MKRLYTFRLDESLAAELKRVAATKNRTVNGLVNHVLQTTVKTAKAKEKTPLVEINDLL